MDSALRRQLLELGASARLIVVAHDVKDFPDITPGRCVEDGRGHTGWAGETGQRGYGSACRIADGERPGWS
jgi:hypothetical protein